MTRRFTGARPLVNRIVIVCLPPRRELDLQQAVVSALARSPLSCQPHMPRAKEETGDTNSTEIRDNKQRRRWTAVCLSAPISDAAGTESLGETFRFIHEPGSFSPRVPTARADLQTSSCRHTSVRSQFSELNRLPSFTCADR